MGFGSSPSPPPPPKLMPPTPPDSLVDAEKLAQQRREIELKRRGRRSLIIDPSPQNNASKTGISIPRP